MILIFTILYTLGTIASGTNYSPVLVWGDETTSVIPTIHKVSHDEFSDVVSPLLQNHMIIAFQEEALNPRSFLCTSSATDESCYAYLKNIPSKTYYSNVENPLKTLRDISPAVEFNEIDVSGKLMEPITCSMGKTVFITFPGTKYDNSDVSTHDAAIKAVTKEITNCPIIYMYLTTGNADMKTQNRNRRNTAATTGGYIFREGDQLLLFFTNLYYIENNVATEIIINSMAVTTVSDTKLSVSLNPSSGKAVTFDVFYAAGYYNVSNVQYNDMAFLSNMIYAPTSFSYSCGDLILPATASLTTNQLNWTSFQIQAPFGSTTNTSFVFGTSWDCVGFISPGIVMGLLIIALFLLITFTGICWMMDINTMDRFDDPKGKTITINAAE